MTTRRAPATPLVVHDPFFSIWSAADRLTDGWPSHWTGRPVSMCGLIRIDGACYRFMGADTRMAPPLPALEQESCEILPTRTIFRFAGAGIGLTLRFLTPALPADPHLMARPATYITCAVTSLYGTAHDVQLHLDVPATICTDMAEAPVVWGRQRHGATHSLWCGAEAQRVLGRSGDECLTDWGYLHLSPEPGKAGSSGIGEARSLRMAFAAAGRLPDRDGYSDTGGIAMPAPASGGETPAPPGRGRNRHPLIVLALATDLGRTEAAGWTTVMAYDHVAQIAYLDRSLPPLWRHDDPTAIAMIDRAWSERATLEARCSAFDAELVADMERTAGPVIARLGTLAFRQCLGAHALVADRDGTLLHFSKENSSNGCLGTVDLTYPASPFFLLFNPALLTAQMRFILDYAASDRWNFDFAPHDIGRYPLANGQVYGGGETGEADQMPFEECGNMLILAAALAQVTEDAEQLRGDWPVLSRWADYIAAQGFDPGEQLCTDDFDGHMAHNANLAIKGILALGAAARLAEMLGESGAAYRAAAEKGAASWAATERDHAHYRMCFDRPGSWSLKYNLVWDRFLDLGLFDPDIARNEMRHYREMAGPHGTPLHSHAPDTKLDWLVWAACLTGEPEDRDALLAPLDAWLDAAPDRVPLSDWFETQTGRQARGHGFFARSVVGGVFLPMLFEPGLLEKWSKRS